MASALKTLKTLKTLKRWLSKPPKHSYPRAYLRKMRFALQWGLFALVLHGGYKFYLFKEHFISGTPFVQRPPLVDGFLPIGALMSLRLWATEGVLHMAHPAAPIIFISAVLLSITFKKSFCGWICPVGTLSEAAFKAGKRLFGRNFKMPRYLDYPLRSLKYILMGFFIYIVFLGMPVSAISSFLNTSYWKIADVKMLEFFTMMTPATAVVLAACSILSLFFKNFWCRYLCPYGALLGILSILSPLKVTRDEEACTHCGRCTENCPGLLPVDKKRRVRSPECMGCLTCVSMCPSKGALEIALPGKKRVLYPLVSVLMVIVVFFGIIGAAQLAGRWQSNVTYDDYKALVPTASRLEHP